MTGDKYSGSRPQKRYLREGAMEGRARKAKASNLISKWKAALDDYDGPGEALLLTKYRVDRHVPNEPEHEVTGMIIWDSGGRAHHFRLHDTSKVVFIESPEDPEANITIDPYDAPEDNTMYVTGGIPPAVSERLAAMDLSPAWSEACQDGEHDYELTNQGSETEEDIVCQKCGISRSTLSWLGHAVPTQDL